MKKTLKKSKIASRIKGKTILITGGTGSFGNTVVKSLLDLKPHKVIIFSRDEKKQYDMRDKFQNPLLRFVIGDVRDRDSVRNVVNGVDYIFHAAALKQVPTCEFFPLEAVKTNIIGTSNVIDAAIDSNVERMVILTTDKAVYPINAMGMSKGLMEKVMSSYAQKNYDYKNKKTILCCVRYGNVLYSRGSVLPRFVGQIKKNKNLSVTNPDMTRFLLPLDEAVDLVFHALVFGKDGYLYTRKSPACTIETLARATLEIFNSRKKIELVGVRAGEKMHETLISREEMSRAIESEKFFTVPPQSGGLDYDNFLSEGNKSRQLDRDAFTSENAERLNVSATVKMLLKVSEIRDELSMDKVNL